MKKYILIIAVAIASLFAYSCTSGSIDREEAPVPAVKLVPLVLNSGVSVKTSLNSDGTVSWSDNDQIAVIDRINEVRPFSSSISEDRTSATFKGNVADGTEQFYAVYPFGSVTAADKSSISVTLPASQNPTPGTFENNLNISVASGSKSPGVEAVNGVKFNNLCGLLRFTMPDELGSINKVSFTANRAIAGDLTIAKETMKFTGVTGTVSTITKEGNFKEGSTFYFVITPGDIVGFSISVTTSNGVILTKSSENKIQISAGKIKNLGTIPMVVANENLSVAHTTSEGILTGTEVKFTPSIEENTEFTAELLDITGNVVRTLNSTATGSELILPAVDGQPYIPQGPYVFRYSYTINGVRYTKAQTVAVPKPKFEGKTTVSATTSYSLAKNGNTSAANSYDASKIGAISATCSAISSISSDVLAQVPVSYVISLDNTAIASGTTTEATVSPGDKASQALGEHPLNATFTFDNVQLTAKSTAVITGLPYSAIPSKDGGWTTNMELYKEYAAGINWNNSGRVSINPGMTIPLINLDITPEIYSPKFYSPGDFYMSLSIVSDLEIKGKKKDNYSEAVLICSIGDEILIERHGDKTLCSPNSYITWKTATESNVVSTKSHKLSKGETNLTIYNNAKVSGTPLVYISNVSVMY